jgi:hypothetical protein
LTTSAARRLALDVLGDDEQGLARARRGLEDGQELAHVRDLAVVDEDQRLVELGRQLREVRREVGREVALVEGHALDDLDLGIEAGVLLDRDHALVADLLERVGEHAADFAVVVGGDRGDAGLLGLRLDLARLAIDPAAASAALSMPLRSSMCCCRSRRTSGPLKIAGQDVPSSCCPCDVDVFFATSEQASPMFSSGSSRSISLATETPSFVTVMPKDFWR